MRSRFIREAISQESNFSHTIHDELKDYQQILGLTNEDVRVIERRVLGTEKIMERDSVQSPPPPIPDTITSFSFEVVTVNEKGKEMSRSSSQAECIVEDLGEGVTLEMVRIPGGTFTMGSPENELHRNSNESPQHQVTVQPFLMGKYPITQAQWRRVANLPGLQRKLNPDPANFKGNNCPVERVSWYDVVEFCARIAQKTGKLYRLPSEAEWEYAGRAGTQTPFHFGETITTDLASYDGTHF